MLVSHLHEPLQVQETAFNLLACRGELNREISCHKLVEYKLCFFRSRLAYTSDELANARDVAMHSLRLTSELSFCALTVIARRRHNLG